MDIALSPRQLDGDTVPPRRRSQPPRWLLVGGVAVVSVPLIAALMVQREPRWYPILDFAMFELRLRDIGTRDTPLVGPVARLFGHETQGNHPGPISFYMMWPVYRSLGGTAWAMQVASASMHVLATGVAVWTAFRRGGTRLGLGAIAVAALVLRGFGTEALTTPWNPYLSIMWWLAFLLAVWSVIDDDVAMLPIAVLTGSVCLQNHIEYAGLTLGLGALSVGLVMLRARRERTARRQLLRCTAMAVTVGVVVWIPPLINELTRSPGNISTIWDHFRQPTAQPLGVGRGFEAVLTMLSPWRLLSGGAVESDATTGSLVPGSILVIAWLATAAASLRLGHRPLIRLHLLLGVTLVLGALTLSRVTGTLWFWLGLWVTVTAALLIGAATWTICRLVCRSINNASLVGRGHVLTAAVGATAGVLTLITAVDAADTAPNNPRLSARLAVLVPSTARALDAVPGPDRGREGRYVITWTDPVNLGMHGFGLLNELDRLGFDVGTNEATGAAVTDHRVRDPRQATAEIHLSVGSDIDVWRAKPGVEEVAYVDDRNPRERGEYARLLAEVANGLRAHRLPELVPDDTEPLILAALDERVPETIRAKLNRLMEIGLPTAVFVGPPQAIVPAEG
jgi:hypothetical protein